MSEEMVQVKMQNIFENNTLPIIGDLSGMSPEVYKQSIRDSAKKVFVVGDRLSLVQGELLHEISEKKLFHEWGYGTFDEYIEGELHYKRRKAYYLIKIYDKYVQELALPTEQLREITENWSKAKELLPIITKENHEKVLEDVVDMSVAETAKYVKLKKGPIKTEGEFSRLSFTVSKEQNENIERAMCLAAKIAGSEKAGHILDLMSSDFISGNIEECPEDLRYEWLERMVLNIEHTFGCEVEIKDLK